MTTSSNEFLTKWIESFRKVHEGLNLLSGYSSDQMGTFLPLLFQPTIKYEIKDNLQDCVDRVMYWVERNKMSNLKVGNPKPCMAGNILNHIKR